MTVPANGSTYIGIVNGLTNSKAYYFALTALVGSTESTAVVFGSSVIIGAPTAAQAIKGTVTFPSIPGTNVLYVVAEPQQVGAKAIATRISNPTSPQNFSIPVPPGQYQFGAFLDVGNDGILDPTEPSNFANRTIVTVSSGTDVTGQNLALTSTNVDASLTTMNSFFGSCPGTFPACSHNESLQFIVSSGLANRRSPGRRRRPRHPACSRTSSTSLAETSVGTTARSRAANRDAPALAPSPLPRSLPPTAVPCASTRAPCTNGTSWYGTRSATPRRPGQASRRGARLAREGLRRQPEAGA